jgi:hypothetical protein
MGLLLLIAFFGHDILMAAPRPAHAAERPSLSLTPGALAPHASSPHPQGCEINRPAVLKTPDAPPLQPTTPAMIVHTVLSRPVGLPSHTAATQARSPTAQRAVLQIFRI